MEDYINSDTDEQAQMAGINKKYLVWNNKGGVGKTFLTYNLAVEYAISHPEEDVVVIDACPQSNVSEIILGGNGVGEENLNALRDRNTTIAGYIKERFSTSPLSRMGNESSYFVRVNQVNLKMPENLYLLPGDVDLDICSRLISHIGSSPVKEAWKKSRYLLVDLIESFEADKSMPNRPKTFFIDCNPSFASYTELGVVASNRIIIPCTADAASIRGIKNLVKLIFGVSIDNSEQDEMFLDFNKESKQNKIELPKLHVFVQNRSRTNESDAAKAFKSHAEEIRRITGDLLKTHSNLFTDVDLEERVKNVKDGNTLAAIINHEGCPLSKLQHKSYTIYGMATQANKAQIQSLESDVKYVVGCL
ncbi:Septum formation inhibitor-activating ATPase [Yersinia mollaretii]|uniref:ParA family protein n=1 Tax=Yersinia mollaretii TaxID=33060 RepID=UPI0005E41E64|nr:ParA family protein [Yersinia mollaretii]CQR03038.1 Septum formation inhibitor-activating ATPase [Yersinia mollaretii]